MESSELWTWFWWANTALMWTIRLIMTVVIVSRRRSPSAALAWLTLTYAIPLVGMGAYFLVGENRLGERRRRKHLDTVKHIESQLTFNAAEIRRHQATIDGRFCPIANLAEGLGASAPLSGHGMTLLAEPETLVESLERDIDNAQHHCHLLYYLFNTDRLGRQIATALGRAVQRGVSCRLLVDAVGSKMLSESDLWQQLVADGVQISSALPVHALRARVARLDLRNHRKLAVIDGRIAYTGSHNLTGPIYPRKAHFGSWIDASVRIEGPCVAALQMLFLEDWYAERRDLPDRQEIESCVVGDSHEPPQTGGTWETDSNIIAQVLPTGPLSEATPLQRVILQALHGAENEIVFTTPYFVPDDATVVAIQTAALRGVEVNLVVPRVSDNWIAQAAGRSFYGELLGAGVKVHEFAEGLLHAKTLTVDTDFALIGSANLDIRSFMLNFELAVLIYDDDFASELRFLQGRYIQQSESLTLKRWRDRPGRQRIGDPLAKLLSPLL
ncbi:MAG: cardiolipin synthase [Planctomycetes bacterium]|nr:cardiolipin synthase [Planctomycetota bacterium]NOG54701.1 cardiolipin synthase [Planctomycetota bacterium]